MYLQGSQLDDMAYCQGRTRSRVRKELYERNGARDEQGRKKKPREQAEIGTCRGVHRKVKSLWTPSKNCEPHLRTLTGLSTSSLLRGARLIGNSVPMGTQPVTVQGMLIRLGSIDEYTVTAYVPEGENGSFAASPSFIVSRDHQTSLMPNLTRFRPCCIMGHVSSESISTRPESTPDMPRSGRTNWEGRTRGE